MADSQIYMRDPDQMEDTISICAVMLDVFARSFAQSNSLQALYAYLLHLRRRNLRLRLWCLQRAAPSTDAPALAVSLAPSFPAA